MRDVASDHRLVAWRSLLITYGIAAYGFFMGRVHAVPASGMRGHTPSGPNLVLIGLVLQGVLLLARYLVKRFAPDGETALQGVSIVSLLGDGVTVLLFAWGTLAATLPVGADL